MARNNQPVIDAINRVKVRRKAFSITIMTSLLSTQIFHTINKAKKKTKNKTKKKIKNKKKMRRLIDFCFKTTEIWCHMDQW